MTTFWQGFWVAIIVMVCIDPVKVKAQDVLNQQPLSEAPEDIG